MEQVLEIIAIILSLLTGGGTGTIAVLLNKKNKNIKEQSANLQKENENIKSELKTINKEIANIQNINNIYIKEFNELKSEIQLSILRIETKLDIMTVNFNNKLSNNNEINIKHKQGDKKNEK
ncbi:hypothetical protein [Spiroplasma endosymbiont of Poecilobothrus nobilitatus]|uniref:hypothetical protein n=1 Tax=Spiroplasma endosymbiont of Poecilobothrus nobilitatus TaxID=1209220 RepID=UPI00313AD6DF